MINQKRLHKIVGKLLYYAIYINFNMLFSLKSMVVVQNKPTMVIAKHITNFLNYCASHPDAVT